MTRQERHQIGWVMLGGAIASALAAVLAAWGPGGSAPAVASEAHPTVEPTPQALLGSLPDPSRAAHGSRAQVRPGTLFLGDSVMLGAKPWLDQLPGRVDAVESRQAYAGLSIVARLAAHRRLPGTLVVGLGTNGQFPRYICDGLHRAVGPDGRLLLVTVRVPRSWTQTDNAVIRQCARRYDNVSLIPWRAYSAQHPAVFAPDGFHLSSVGGRRYAQLVRHSL
jgi:hypothetical protein